jgi:protein O-mannosyl-transferase
MLQNLSNIDKSTFKKCLLLFSVLSFLIYGKSISNKYSMDDEYVTANNLQIHGGIKKIPEIFKTSYSLDKKASFEYRPIVKATYAIEYQFFGEKPGVSHFINILIYILSMFLLFYFLLRLLPDYNYIFSLTIVLIFLVHPLHSEVVISLKNRDGMLSFIGCLLSMHFYLRFVEGKGKWNILAGVFFAFFAILSKKDFFPFFVLIPFTLWFFRNANWKKILIVFVSLLPAYLLFRLSAKTVSNHVIRDLLYWENPLFINSTLWERIPQGFYCIFFYLKMFLLPYPLIAYYGYNQVPIVGWNNPIVWIIILLLIITFYFIIKNLLKKPLWAYGIIYFLVTISMFTNIVIPVVGIVGERFMYIPSLGLCMLTVYFLFIYFKIPFKNTELKLKNLNVRFLTLVTIFIFISGVRTFARNSAWKDTYTIYKTDVMNAPESAHLHSLLASTAIKKVQDNPRMPISEKRDLVYEAESNYLDALRILPDYTAAHNNLGMVYYTYLKNNEKAAAHFKKAIELDSNYVEAYFNLGSSYAASKQLDLAEKCYLKSIELDPEFKNSYQSLSGVYSAEKNSQKILDLNQNAINKGIVFDGLYINIGNVYFLEGDTLKALPYLEKAIEINPRNKGLNSFLYNYYQNKGNAEKASVYYKLMISNR